MKCLSIIIPFLNEAATLKSIVLEIMALKDFPYRLEVIFVNDGSTDASADIVQECQALLEDKQISHISLSHTPNRGKWYACKRGIEVATGDFFIIQDADLEYSPTDYLVLLDLLENNNLDFVYGSRNRGFWRNGFHFSYISFLLGGIGLSLLTSLVVGRWITDEPTCYKLFRSALRADLLLPEENGFEWEPAITVLLCRRWYRYGETGISYFPRKVEAGKKIRWYDGVKAIQTLIKWKLHRFPDTILNTPLWK